MLQETQAGIKEPRRVFKETHPRLRAPQINLEAPLLHDQFGPRRARDRLDHERRERGAKAREGQARLMMIAPHRNRSASMSNSEKTTNLLARMMRSLRGFKGRHAP